MKSILSILVLASAIFAAASYTAPTNYQMLGPADAIWGWKVATEASPKYLNGYNPGTALDKMTGADTITLLTKFPVDKDGLYSFVIVDSAGAADSFRVEFSVWSGGFQGAWTPADTIAGVAAVNKITTVTIPSGITQNPTWVSMRAVKWIATLVAKVRYLEVQKRSLVK